MLKIKKLASEHIEFIDKITLDELKKLGFRPSNKSPMHDELHNFLEENNLSLIREYKKDIDIFKCVDNVNDVILFEYWDRIIVDLRKNQATKYFTKII